jgi:hypothetical protein
MPIPISQIATLCLCGFTGLAGDLDMYVGFVEVARSARPLVRGKGWS